MPEIEIRPAIQEDIPALLALDHTYVSDYVWQMDIQQTEERQFDISFRRVRLPRSVRVDYPRSYRALAENWDRRPGLLVAQLQRQVIGYISLTIGIAPLTAWITDLVVSRPVRRQGIGSALVLAGQEWGLHRNCRELVLEMQPKNHPAVLLAQKLGFNFYGYNDRYYANQDIGLFFGKSIR